MNVHKLSLLDILNHFFIKDIVDVLYSCENCHNKSKQLKKIQISKLPKILILSIQRFDYTKNIQKESVIEIPLSINMNAYINNDCNKDNNNNYVLFAVIIHIGLINFGHYAAILKANNNWKEYNDININEVNILDNN